jgi:hypothetical protein
MKSVGFAYDYFYDFARERNWKIDSLTDRKADMLTDR